MRHIASLEFNFTFTLLVSVEQFLSISLTVVSKVDVDTFVTYINIYEVIRAYDDV